MTMGLAIHGLTVPGAKGASLFQHGGGFFRPFEYNGWKKESMSWKMGCYIHAGLSSPFGQITFRGPDVIKFWKRIAINSFEKFPIGSAKHAVMCNEAGLVTSHGVLQRNADDEVQLFVAGLWANYQHAISDLDVEMEFKDNFLFQISGPTSLKVLEQACGESLTDIGFLRFRKTRVAGKDVEIMRVGMSGTLAYELHGSMADGDAVYDAVVEAGKNDGLERLGWRTYTVNHVEAGFPQNIWTFYAATDEDAGYRNFVTQLSPESVTSPIFSGSVDPANMRARYRTPMEAGWEKMARFDHDFIGRAAIEEEARNPRRKIVTLLWNNDDVVDIYASLFREGQEFKTLDLPCAPPVLGMLAHADHVMLNGREVGYSSGTIYSYYFRQVLSHGVIDVEDAQIGKELTVLWGDHGGRLKEVRATVARYPYLDLPRNQDITVG